MMLANSQDPGLTDTDADGDREIDRDRYEDPGPQRGVPPAAQQPTPRIVTPPPAQPSPGEVAAGPGPQDDGKAPRAMAPAGQKARDEDGRVPYTHTADSVTERVWPSVAHAYETAYSNKGGTDGKAAYAGTEAEWLDAQALAPVDPNELASGDLITFDNGSAVLRVQRKDGDPEGGIVDAIIKGELTPVANVMAADIGELGAFAGFRRPPGVEPPAPVEGSTGGAGPEAPGDESGGGVDSGQ
ncbi:hypothetical protein [Nocardia carnea]|uniref:hypothetical protein n=1 Tax=Nocardia carnea TaxID=37328 RepID=UPI0024565DF5|nr:hypothetical protein [Nocardia carnea]